MSKELIKLLRAEIARTVDLDMMHHNAANRIEELEREVESLKASMYGHYELEAERDALLADNERLPVVRAGRLRALHRSLCGGPGMSPSEILLALELAVYAAAIFFIGVDAIAGWKSRKGDK